MTDCTLSQKKSCVESHIFGGGVCDFPGATAEYVAFFIGGNVKTVNIKALAWDIMLRAMRMTAAEAGFEKTGLTCAEIVAMMGDFENMTKTACKDAGVVFDEASECQASRG